MNIAINTAGFHEIGTGHVHRQLALMEDRPENNYFFFIREDNELAIRMLKESLVDFFFFNEKTFFDLLKKFNIQIVINDFLNTEVSYINKIKEHGILTVNFEDKGSGIETADIVINDMYDMKITKKNLYTGYEYTCIRGDMKLYKPISFQSFPKNIIITFGGTDPQNFTKKTLDLLILNRINNFINITVILGLGYKYDEEIYSYERQGIRVFKNVKNMPALLQKADIGITANGRTLFEFAMLGVPCISLAQNAREKIHTFADIENGVVFLGERHDFTDEHLLQSIIQLVYNHQLRLKLREKMLDKAKIFEKSNENIWNLINNKFKYQSFDIILQCRTNSSRFPNKVIKIIQDKNIIEHIISRLKKCQNIDKLILCTTDTSNDDIIEMIGKKNDIHVFRGSEHNVLERYYNCAKHYKSKNIIRCTGDCPLIDPLLIDNLIEEFHEMKFKHLNFRDKDITRNKHFPDGFDAEIFTFEVLEEAYKNDKSEFNKEHVTPYIVSKYGHNYYKIPNTERFFVDYNNFHLSVDTEEDYKRVLEIYKAVYNKKTDFTIYDVLEYIQTEKYQNVTVCPLCLSDNSVIYSNNKTHFIRLNECTKCQIIYNDKILKEEFFIEQVQNYNNDRIKSIKSLSSHSNRQKQYDLDFEFINSNIDVSNKRILDFGCGTGEFLERFDTPHKFGIEVDETMTDTLYERNISKIKSIDENYFDIIIFRGTFHTVRNLREIIEQVKNNLYPDGHLIILQIPNKNSPCFQILKDDWSLCVKTEFLHYWASENIEQVFPNFHTVNIQYPYKETPYYSKTDIHNFHKSITTEEKVPFAFYDNMFNIILRNNLTKQNVFSCVKINHYKDEINQISFDDDNYNSCPADTIVNDFYAVFLKLSDIENKASGDWDWISKYKTSDVMGELIISPEIIFNLYSNFARNPLSFGVISNGTYESIKINNEKLSSLKSSILHDIDNCIELCGITNISVLESPRIGNFYGITKNGIFITPDNVRHYYCAFKIQSFIEIENRRPTILEIGGGYGGVLVNLLKQNQDFCYINVDIKNTLLLFYFYVSNFINENKLNKKIILALDGKVTNEMTQEYDIILVPNNYHKFISCNADIVFNSHSFSEMNECDLEEYFQNINKLNIEHIFHINSIYFPWKTSDRGHIQISSKDFPIGPQYKKIYQCISPWAAGSGRYREYYYKQD